MYYSVIGLLTGLTLIIVNQDILLNPKVSFVKPAWKVYRRFLCAVLIYCFTDILWGIIESRKLATALFVDTTIYFIAMAAGVALWANYTVAYLDENNKFGTFLKYTGNVFALVMTSLAIINIFKPILFEVDKDCVYHELPVRNMGLLFQIMLLVIISIYCFSSMIISEKEREMRTRFRILGSFGVIMAICLFIQLLFPYLPVYSIGYMLGTCMLHTFVASDEKEVAKREQEEAKKVEELKDRFRSLIDNMPGMAFTKDSKTGVYITCNRLFAQYAHKDSPDDVVGLTDAEIFDAKTAAHFVETDKLALSLSKPYVYFEDVPDAEGNQKQLQTTKLKYTDTSGRQCVLGMCQDVTDMVRIQHEHAMTQEAYENAVSSGLMYTNIAQTLARDYIDLYYVNTDTEEFIQYQRDEETGSLSEIRRGWHFFSDCKMELAENVFEDDRDSFLAAMKRKTLMAALNHKDTFVMAYRQIGEGEPFYVNMKISRMEDVKYIIIGITNVDAEMRETMAKNVALAEALSEAEQANKVKSTFLSGMSHEIRTPMNVIIGLDKMALRNGEMDDKTRDYLERIGDSANSLLKIINEILDVSHDGKSVQDDAGEEGDDGLIKKLDPSALKILVVDDNMIETEHAKMVLDEVGLTADVCNSGQEALKKLEAAHGAFKPYNIVLMDWIMPGMSGKDTAKEIRRIYKNETMVVALTASNWLEIEEEAHSVGVERYLMKPLFAESILGDLESIVQRSGMNIFMERKRAKLSGRRVLVADDVSINAEILMDTLEIENIKSDYAKDGKEAVEMFENSTAGIYAAILMDVRMPEMDGLEATRIIRAMDRDDAKRIPIIALTANAFEEDVQHSLAAGMNAHLAKPVDADTLARVLGELIYEAEN